MRNGTELSGTYGPDFTDAPLAACARLLLFPTGRRYQLRARPAIPIFRLVQRRTN